MNLPIFDKIKGLSEDKQHAKFKLLQSNFQFRGEKGLLYSYTDGLIDKDKKMVREFQETFHSVYWEICIYQLCIEAGFSLDQTHNIPDFNIKTPSEFYIEAVISNIKQTGIKENERTLEDQMSLITPPYLQKDFFALLDESIIRNSNAIFYKINKYKDYKNKSWFNEKKPFIIALSSHDQINYGREFIYPMLALLYGKYYIPEKDDYIIKKKIIKKETSAELPLGIFLDSEYSQVSAIMYTCMNTIGKLTALASSNNMPIYNKVIDIIRNFEDDNIKFEIRVVDSESPERISDGIFIFHNPHAKDPICPSLFDKTNVTHVFLEDDNIKLLGNTTPLYTRISLSKLFLNNSSLLNQIINECECIFNKK